MSPVDANKLWSAEEVKHYPAPLASHDDVVKDPTVFWDTLRRFHFVMGTKFMIPVIGGKELDLHVLYVEVTRRSGYEKVVAEKKWREVGNVFRFSPTTTSASFVLRKHYLSLLYHYEQVHFFKARGPLFTPSSAAFSVSNQSWRPELAIVEYSPNRINECPTPPSHHHEECYNKVNGTIEGKFDCGYLISVKVGSEVLKGVLYHPQQSETDGASVSQCNSGNAIVPYNAKSRRLGRRRRNKRRWDPNYPKPNRSGYNFFFAEKHYKLKSLYPNREREFTKMIGQSWSSLSPEERMVYQNIGLRDKERYKRELREYKEKMKHGHGSQTQAVQLAILCVASIWCVDKRAVGYMFLGNLVNLLHLTVWIPVDRKIASPSPSLYVVILLSMVCSVLTRNNSKLVSLGLHMIGFRLCEEIKREECEKAEGGVNDPVVAAEALKEAEGHQDDEKELQTLILKLELELELMKKKELQAWELVNRMELEAN
ncbi:high mobility group B protein 9 [Senna tora]|uniref:High mobility group B protein 9 n=1 Tax=Senna tora TaxID=362788 RepID=A0A834WQA2_9FABA|nr:high mobility group B protein 9 [Senna tora]